MSGFFDDDDQGNGAPVVVPQPTSTPQATKEIGLLSDEAKAELRAAREKATAAAKEKAKQAGQAATQVAQRARAEWLPKGKGWLQAERAKGVRKGIWMFGAGTALLTVAVSAGIWWHAQSHLVPPKAEAPKVVAEAPVAKMVEAPVAQAPVTTPAAVESAPAMTAQPVEVQKMAPVAQDTAIAQAPKPEVATPKALVLKPVPFNPTSREYRSPTSKPKVAAAPKPKAKTEWEKQQEAKLDAFFKR